MDINMLHEPRGMKKKAPMSFKDLRKDIIGVNAFIATPFGRRLLTYADYTASGRSLRFIEQYIQHSLLPYYGNAHTEDSYTGRFMTHHLHDAQEVIKQSVNAGKDYCVIACGAGSTAAIIKLQEVLGVFIPPATRQRIGKELGHFFGDDRSNEFTAHLTATQPVVFVGPYEHHSNEISWRCGLATVVPVNLGSDGEMDIEHLRQLLQDERYRDRVRIGSFSAASNVTGTVTDVRAVAALLHEHGAFACFDFAASAPYVEIDVTAMGLDAVFISPHKLVGGVGSSGVLVFRKAMYDERLPPTQPAGGTVQFVNAHGQDFLPDIEERETPGTPGVMQTIRAALALELKQAIGADRIEEREQAYLRRAFERWGQNDCIQILGPSDPAKRVAIVSFLVRDKETGKLIHPKLVTTLLNDLFGIQSRAGCSCAGPYGHRLLNVSDKESEVIRTYIQRGFHGLKIGWCRLGFHFAHDIHEVDYIIDAVLFIVEYAHLFLSIYTFDVRTGVWSIKPGSIGSDLAMVAEPKQPQLGLGLALEYRLPHQKKSKQWRGTQQSRIQLYKKYLQTATAYAKALALQPSEKLAVGRELELQPELAYVATRFRIM